MVAFSSASWPGVVEAVAGATVRVKFDGGEVRDVKSTCVTLLSAIRRRARRNNARRATRDVLLRGADGGARPAQAAATAVQLSDGDRAEDARIRAASVIALPPAVFFCSPLQHRFFILSIECPSLSSLLIRVRRFTPGTPRTTLPCGSSTP